VTRARAAALVLALAAVGAAGCDTPFCAQPDDEFVVDEVGSCAAAGAQQLTLALQSCRVYVRNDGGKSGLPPLGALSSDQRPLRQGGFILYRGSPTFELCRARRVDYRLQLSCVDASGAGVCEAALTEPAP
jgi:hypothetical protein